MYGAVEASLNGHPIWTFSLAIYRRTTFLLCPIRTCRLGEMRVDNLVWIRIEISEHLEDKLSGRNCILLRTCNNSQCYTNYIQC